MINIYVTKISYYTKADVQEKIAKLVSEDTNLRGKKFYFFDDTKRSLIGEAMARYAIETEFNISNDQITFKRNEFGKPELQNFENIDFNISHSSEYVVCAVGNSFVGVDVERIKGIDFEVGRRFFSTEEYKDLCSQEEENKLRYFYRIWTLKESYMKVYGKGLSIAPNTFSIKIEDNTYKLMYSLEGKDCYFKQYNIESNYVLSACAFNNNFCDEVIDVKPEDIFRKMLESR